MSENLSGEIPTIILQHLSDGSCQTIDQIETALQFSKRQISNGAASLIKRDYLDRIEAGCYRLTASGQEAAARGEKITSGPIRTDTCIARKPQRNSLRQRAWTAMRMSGSFTIGDIVIVAARDDLDPESNVQRYLQMLRAGGYVAEMPTRQRGTHVTSNGFKRFRLIKDTGPIAPVWKSKLRVLWDHNLREFVGGEPCDR